MALLVLVSLLRKIWPVFNAGLFQLVYCILKCNVYGFDHAREGRVLGMRCASLFSTTILKQISTIAWELK